MLFALIQSILACNPDVLVDDFKAARLLPLDIEVPPPMRYFNLIGGDYGIKEENNNAIKVFPNETNGYMNIYAELGPEDTSEAYTHPGKPNSRNYWYVKFDKYACFDLTPFKFIQFDLKAPAGSEMTFVLTQKAPNCTEFPTQTARLIDSDYQLLSKYATMDGTKKQVKIPLSDFKMNLEGKEFDMKHLKDFTIVDIVPAANMELSNFWLVGDCTPNGSTNSGNTGSVPQKPAGSGDIRGAVLGISIFAAALMMF